MPPGPSSSFEDTSTRPLPALPRWEPVARDAYRLAVPGGWLYKTTSYDGQALALVFVPTPDLGRLVG